MGCKCFVFFHIFNYACQWFYISVYVGFFFACSAQWACLWMLLIVWRLNPTHILLNWIVWKYEHVPRRFHVIIFCILSLQLLRLFTCKFAFVILWLNFCAIQQPSLPSLWFMSIIIRWSVTLEHRKNECFLLLVVFKSEECELPAQTPFSNLPV